MRILIFYRISLNTMTLQVESPTVYTCQGVPISVTGIAQVIRLSFICIVYYVKMLHIFITVACNKIDIFMIRMKFKIIYNT